MKKKKLDLLICQLEDSRLKLAGFSRKRSRRNVCCLLAQERLPQTQDDRELSSSIRSIINKLYLSEPEWLFISLPRNRVTWKHLRIPSNSSVEIKQASSLHAGRLMFLPQEEVISVHEIIFSDARNGALASIMATSRANVARYYELFSFIRPWRIKLFLSSMGIAGIFGQSAHKKTGRSLVLETGRDHCEAALIRNGRLAYARSFVLTSGNGYLSALSAEARATIDYYSREVERGPVKDVYLLEPGLLGSDKNKIRELSDLLGLRVKSLFYPSLFPSEPNGYRWTDSLSAENISYAAISGLGLRAYNECIDFSLPEVKKNRHKRRLRFMALSFIIALAAATFTVSSWFFMLERKESLRFKEAAGSLNALAAAAMPLLDAQNRMFELSRRWDQDSANVSKILFDLSSAAKESGIELQKLSYEKDKRLFVQGKASEWGTARGFIGALSHIPFFFSWRQGQLFLRSGGSPSEITGKNIFFSAEWVKVKK